MTQDGAPHALFAAKAADLRYRLYAVLPSSRCWQAASTPSVHHVRQRRLRAQPAEFVWTEFEERWMDFPAVAPATLLPVSVPGGADAAHVAIVAFRLSVDPFGRGQIGCRVHPCSRRKSAKMRRPVSANACIARASRGSTSLPADLRGFPAMYTVSTLP